MVLSNDLVFTDVLLYVRQYHQFFRTTEARKIPSGHRGGPVAVMIKLTGTQLGGTENCFSFVFLINAMTLSFFNRRMNRIRDNL